MKLFKIIFIFLILLSSNANASNFIHKKGNCGFAYSGVKDYLINTDNTASYRVTVRIHARRGIDNRKYDRVYIIAAGSKKYLGCTDSNNIPVTDYSRSIVGQERL